MSEDFDIALLKESFGDNIFGFYSRLIELEIIPFDIIQSLASDKNKFGFLGYGPRIGMDAQVFNVPMLVIDNKEYDFNNWVGKVVGDFGGRIVVQVENIFYGWLTDEDFKLVDVERFYNPGNITN